MTGDVPVGRRTEPQILEHRVRPLAVVDDHLSARAGRGPWGSSAHVVPQNTRQPLAWLPAHITDPVAAGIVQVWDNAGGLRLTV